MGFMDSLKGIVRAKPGVTPLSKKDLRDKMISLNHDQLPFAIGPGSDFGMKFLPRPASKKHTRSGCHSTMMLKQSRLSKKVLASSGEQASPAFRSRQKNSREGQSAVRA